MNSCTTVLHHAEICVENEKKLLRLFLDGMGFNLTHIRRSNLNIIYQWVVQSHEIRFIITKISSANSFKWNCPTVNSSSIINDENNKSVTKHYPVLSCCDPQSVHKNDSVFNIALETKSVENVTTKIKESDGHIIIEPQDIADQDGTVNYAVVGSKCPNVIHTIINKKNYFGSFLPGFEKYHSDFLNNDFNKDSITSYIDHVTYVCRMGESDHIIKFYENCFGMKRFVTNRQETEEGFVLRDNIGLRLKAMQFWRCAESGVAAPGDLENPCNLKLVLAEPLPEIETSHVQNFLRENKGPGVQHIGLYSSNMIETVDIMSRRGVPFRHPPSTYYNEDCGKLKDIKEVGLGNLLEKIRNLGILLDREEDTWLEESHRPSSVRFLMQIFTHPIFERDTFFLEVIERKGAIGFGAGNITALAKSILKYQEELQKNYN